MNFREALAKIEETYGTLDFNELTCAAADRRVGSGHEESAGAVNRCGKCGPLDLDGEAAAAAGIDPVMHPECYTNDFVGCDLVARCSVCDELATIERGHYHRYNFIGACCWDERLRTTE